MCQLHRSTHNNVHTSLKKRDCLWTTGCTSKHEVNALNNNVIIPAYVHIKCWKTNSSESCTAFRTNTGLVYERLQCKNSMLSVMRFKQIIIEVAEVTKSNHFSQGHLLWLQKIKKSNEHLEEHVQILI